MQRFKTTILLASILGILIVATIGASIASKKRSGKNEGGAFVAFNTEEVDKIEVINSGKTQELSKTGGQWLVSSAGNAKADQTAVSEFLENIKEMTKKEIASANPDKARNFEVSEEKGVQIKLYKGENQLADFFVGKAGPDFNSTYVRAANEDNVYATEGYVRMYFDKSDFRDLIILNFDKEKVSEMVIEKSGSDSVILQKKDGAWKAEWYDKFEMDEDKVNSLLSSLSKLKAKDIITDKDAAAAGLENVKDRVVIKFEDGSDEALNIGSKSDGDYYIKRSAADTIYTLAESRIGEMLKGKDDFSK